MRYPVEAIFISMYLAARPEEANIKTREYLQKHQANVEDIILKKQ
jgi:hypothetical protein